MQNQGKRSGASGGVASGLKISRLLKAACLLAGAAMLAYSSCSALDSAPNLQEGDAVIGPAHEITEEQIQLGVEAALTELGLV